MVFTDKPHSCGDRAVIACRRWSCIKGALRRVACLFARADSAHNLSRADDALHSFSEAGITSTQKYKSAQCPIK
jgi:hypothetical protein